jgi:amino acid transporter
MATNGASLPQATSTGDGLRPNAVGLTGVLFQSIAMMGPAVALAFAFTAGIVYAGGSFPLAIVLALITSLLLALNIGQLALHLPAAGGFYTYVARGLGRIPGFLTGWLTIPVYLLFLPANLLVFGFTAEGFVVSEGGPDIQWWIWMIGIAMVMALLTFFGVRLSTRTLVVLGSIEVGAFVLLSIFLIGHAPDGNMAQAFTPSLSGDADLGGWKGVVEGAIFAFTAFIGFESAAQLAEESDNPRRNIPRAILLSALLIGIFFVFAGYAGLSGYGFNHIFPSSATDTHSFISDPNATPWLTLAGNVWGQAGVVVITLVILNSTAANLGAGYTAFGRILFAMSRAGALPGVLGHLNKRYRTPIVAITLAAVVSMGLALWAESVYGTPPNDFFVIIDVLAFCMLIAYIGVSLATFGYYLRERRSEFSILRHAVLPLLTVILIGGELFAQFAAASPPPTSYPGPDPQILAGFIVLGWLALGIVWVIVLHFSRPAALDASAKVFEMDEAPKAQEIVITAAKTPEAVESAPAQGVY